MVLEIPGLSTLYAIIRRKIDRENDIFSQRKNLADDLMNNCREWASVLLTTFDEAVQRWAREGRNAAGKEIMELQEDFMKINYSSLESSSPIIQFLNEDARFEAFTDSCINFYNSALHIKRLVYGSIEAYPGKHVSESDVGIEEMVRLWKNEVKKMLSKVTHQHMKVKILLPS